jgi:hypothetical protein
VNATEPREVELLAGWHISRACREIAAKVSDSPAFGLFNGIRIDAMPGDSAESLERQWTDKLNEAQRVYEASPEYRERQSERRRSVARKQSSIDSLMMVMDFGTLNDTLVWLEAFTELADDVDVKYDRRAVVDALLAAVYVKGEFVSKDPAVRQRLETDSNAMGHYIVGQALACMIDHNMPPHPITVTFVERWRKDQR